MDVVILIVVMVGVGALLAQFADKIFKGERPRGVQGDYVAAISSTVVVGLVDWFVIPAMNFSTQMQYLGVIFEPAIFALIVLWLMRRQGN